MKYVLIAAVAILVATDGLAKRPDPPTEAVAKVRAFTDQQLRERLEKLLDDFSFRHDALYEPCLSENRTPWRQDVGSVSED